MFSKEITPRLLGTLFVISSIFLFTACNDDDTTEVPNEEEVITTLIYTLTPNGGGNPAVFTFRDLDGDGGNAPTITNGTLTANTTYTGSLTLSNETETPAEDITTEIAEEDDEHQFFFSTTVTGLSVAYADMDDNGNPIGLATTLVTGDAGTGNMTVTLLHEPDKNAAGVSGGSIDNAGGETDISVTFDVNVE